MPDYPFFMVTRGRDRFRVRGASRMVPVALQPKAAPNAFVALRAKMEEAARQRINMFRPAGETGFGVLQAVSRTEVVAFLNDLWLREVRLGAPGEVLLPDEAAIEWVLFEDRFGRMPPRWQGAADLVIPRDTPVTIYPALVDAAPFKLEVAA